MAVAINVWTLKYRRKGFLGPSLELSIFIIFIVSVSPLQGFNATLTEPKDTLGRRGGQIREMELKLHPDLKEPLKKLCDDPKTTIVVLSGSDRSVLDNVQ